MDLPVGGQSGFALRASCESDVGEPNFAATAPTMLASRASASNFPDHLVNLANLPATNASCMHLALLSCPPWAPALKPPRDLSQTQFACLASAHLCPLCPVPTGIYPPPPLPTLSAHFLAVRSLTTLPHFRVSYPSFSCTLAHVNFPVCGSSSLGFFFHARPPSLIRSPPHGSPAVSRLHLLLLFAAFE